MRLPNFKSLRWRIALLFVGLSSIVYVTLTILSALLFRTMMVQALDNQLNVLASTLGRAISVHNNQPHFRQWVRTVETEPNHSIATIQLYDAERHLLERYGPRRYEELVRDRLAVQYLDTTLRVKTSPVIFNGKLLGYMQLELPTDEVEDATRQFGWTMLLIAPLVLLGLAVTSIFVSAQVARPFMLQLHTLRRFVADAGHELNTPLSIVSARLESLAKKMSDRGQSTEELQVVEQSLRPMQKIVQDLMVLAEVEGALSMQPPRVVELGQIVARVVSEFEERYRQKGLILKCQTISAAVPAHADALERMISNLLENALKYTPDGGTVTVSMASKPDHKVQLVIEDTGIGIPPDSLPFIFDRFYRVDKSRSHNSGGIGLGLSIVKAVAEAHSGEVVVTSNLGSGSRFTVTLPNV